MRLLLVVATAAEIAPLVSMFTTTSGPVSVESARATSVGTAGAAAPVVSYTCAGRDIDVLTTGVGMVATAAWCSRLLAGGYDAALNLGVCGSFRRDLPTGSVVHVTADCIAELGAEDDDRFLSIGEMGLLGDNEFPYRHGRLVNTAPTRSAALAALPAVSGITVNTVHGNERSIAGAVERFAPDVESMEGAAFMYASLVAAVPFAQVRAVSNIVEKRNRAAWDLPAAIGRLAEAGFRIINEL